MKVSTAAVVFLVLLVVFGALEGAVIFFVTDPLLRVLSGSVLLVPIMLLSAQLGVINHFLRLAARTNYSRRQKKLRSAVDELLEEVRRLNATALDGERGVRDHEATTELMDAREAAIQALIGRIRDAAGEESDEPLEGVG